MTRRAAAAAVLWTLAACSAPEAGLPAGDDAGWRTDQRIDLTVEVSDYMIDGYETEPRLEDALVCIVEPEPEVCLTTDADGIVVFQGLPAEQELLLRFSKDGYRPVLRPYVTPRESAALHGPARIRLGSETLAAEVFDAYNATREEAGLPPIERDGSLGIVIFGTRFRTSYMLSEDVSFTLDPASGDGPYRGYPGPGAGTYYNVEPGERELIFDYPDGECIYRPGPISGWPSREGRDNATRVPVRAGHTTSGLVLDCYPDEDDAGVAD